MLYLLPVYMTNTRNHWVRFRRIIPVPAYCYDKYNISSHWMMLWGDSTVYSHTDCSFSRLVCYLISANRKWLSTVHILSAIKHRPLSSEYSLWVTLNHCLNYLSVWDNKKSAIHRSYTITATNTYWFRSIHNNSNKDILVQKHTQ